MKNIKLQIVGISTMLIAMWQPNGTNADWVDLLGVMAGFTTVLWFAIREEL